MKTMLIAMLAFTLAPVLLAQNTLTGKDCPEFSATKFINPPADGKTSLADCKGEVILVKLWGVKCGPCLASMPNVQALWSKYEGKGLHIFMVERQNHSEADIQKIYSGKGLTFPQVIEGSMGGFPGVGTIPYAYVIGVDGKVVYEGNKGYGAAIDTEIAKIKYLGLGKNEVAPGLEKAATSFSGGDYAGALDEASKIKAKEGATEAQVADADYIIKRVDERVAGLRARIDAAKGKKRYHEALVMLDTLAGKAYKGIPESEAAVEEAKELRKDKAVKEELKAWDALAKTLEANEKLKTDGERKRALIKFWEKNEGTAAADEARALADGMAE